MHFTSNLLTRAPRRWARARLADEPAGKPDSVVTAEAATGDHPSATAVADGLMRSTRELGRAALERSRRRTRVRPFDLAPGGVYRAAPVTWGAGGLLHRRFTLAPSKSQERFVFCGTVPRVTPGGRYPPPCSSESGLSSTVLAHRRDRLADSSAVIISHLHRHGIPEPFSLPFLVLAPSIEAVA